MRPLKTSEERTSGVLLVRELLDKVLPFLGAWHYQPPLRFFCAWLRLGPRNNVLLFLCMAGPKRPF